MSKELALGLDFKNAPKEIQEAATVYNEKWVRMIKAQKEIQAWNDELKLAAADFRSSTNDFAAAIAKYDPVSIPPIVKSIDAPAEAAPITKKASK